MNQNDESSFVLFGKALLGKWLALLGSAAFTIVGIYALVAQWSTRWLISAEIVLGTALFYIAAWQAWKEERGKRMAVEGQIAKPKRTAAQQHDFDTVSSALKLTGDKGRTALRFLRRRGNITYDFPVQNSTIPPGMNIDDTMWVYNHCASEGVVKCYEKPGSGVKTFSIPPNMAPILDELLFEEGQKVTSEAE